MQTGSTTIRRVFDSSVIFNIPIYQRAYSWEKEKQLKDFFNDILTQHPDKKYFLGTYLFHVREEQGDFQIIDVIDGQQRLTTFVIFMKELIDRLIQSGASEVSERTRRIYLKDGDVYKIKLSNEDSSFLHQHILEDHPVTGTGLQTPSQRLLLSAKQFFKDSLQNCDLNTLNKLYQTAVQAEVLLYVVEEIQAATQIFELLNDRGKRLTDLESLKSFLMHNIGIVSEHPNQMITDIQHQFAEIYRMIERHQLNDDDVLRYHTLAFEKEFELTAKEYIKKKVAERMGAGQYEEAKQLMISYARNLKRSFELFVSILKNEDNVQALRDLTMIGRVAPFYPYLMYAKHESNREFVRLAQALVKFNFRAVLANLRSNAGESYMQTAHKEGRNLADRIEQFCAENWWNMNRRAKDNLKYSSQYESMNRNLVKYILFKYENHLRLIKGFPPLELEHYFNDSAREKLSIEHITAQRVRGITLDEDFHENYMHNLGNLVIDTAASNSSKGNKMPDQKLSAYLRAPIMSQNEIDDFSCNWSDLASIKRMINERKQIIDDFIKVQFEL